MRLRTGVTSSQEIVCCKPTAQTPDKFDQKRDTKKTMGTQYKGNCQLTVIKKPFAGWQKRLGRVPGLQPRLLRLIKNPTSRLPLVLVRTCILGLKSDAI